MYNIDASCKMRATLLATTWLAGLVSAQLAPQNMTWYNPILPGFHPDPSCITVNEGEFKDTFFCVTSTFLAFPAIPVAASKDLRNWKHASNVFNRPAQFPPFGDLRISQREGVWAPTLRYHEGVFYVTVSIVFYTTPRVARAVVFRTENPYDDTAWSEAVEIDLHGKHLIDPDLFWDDDGTVYFATAGINMQTVDLETGVSSEPVVVWPGVGEPSPEGPHLYRKDGWYYLMIASGGTGEGHSIVISRSKNPFGPYEAYSGNPILTNRETNRWFQWTGHGDLFQDKNGNWWTAALARRGEPGYPHFPMIRETVLIPASWETDEWPRMDFVNGTQTGWYLPSDLDVPGEGPFLLHPDEYDFPVGSSIPRNLLFWRFPKEELFQISPPGHENTLEITGSSANLTGPIGFNPVDGLGFIARRQTATVFKYTVDVDFKPRAVGDEAGITVFLVQSMHIDLSIVALNGTKCATRNYLRLQAIGHGKKTQKVPEPVLVPLPRLEENPKFRLQIEAKNSVNYTFTAELLSEPKQAWALGDVSSAIVSGGSTSDGDFVGSLVGAFASTNGGNRTTKAYFSKWRYTDIAQEIAKGEYVPAKTHYE
ncbi:glycoside hydrolase family 43 protein [Paramyrothecium foliicola]|nr:glycoside hydrolase family 43 protein [Paramyrothecium foliicola]